MHIQFRTILSLALASLMIANPALAQSIDLSPVQNLLQGIVDTITGPLGIVIGTLALIGVFLSWLFGILDFRQALWVQSWPVIIIAALAYPALWKAADWDPAFLEVMVTALQETPPTPNRKIHSGDSYAP
jgi:type IV secretion system protein VirB2